MIGKVAFVTGGSAGIGRATALAFARKGARVAVADVDVAGGEESVALLNSLGGTAMFIRLRQCLKLPQSLVNVDHGEIPGKRRMKSAWRVPLT